MRQRLFLYFFSLLIANLFPFYLLSHINFKLKEPNVVQKEMALADICNEISNAH